MQFHLNKASVLPNQDFSQDDFQMKEFLFGVFRRGKRG
jgi:hypothetical protein